MSVNTHMGNTNGETVEHGDWLEELNTHVPEQVGDWELRTEHGRSYIEHEISHIVNEFVEWKLDSEYSYYLRLTKSVHQEGTVYGLKIERPLGGTRLPNGKRTSCDQREIIENAISFMEKVKSEDIESMFYGEDWFPTLGE